MKRFYLGTIVLIGILISLTGSSWGKNITLDKTNNIAGWLVFRDNAAAGTMSIAPGPKSGQRAFELAYDLKGGNWVAWVKKTSDGMEGFQALVFDFKGEGDYTFEVKIADTSGATFGIQIPGGTNVPNWKEVVIPLSEMKYLWGGSTKVLDPKRIRQYEFAVSTAQGGNSGRILVSNIRYSNTPRKAKLPVAVAKPKKTKVVAGGQFGPLGRVEIEGIGKWKKFSDRGAAVKLSLSEVIVAGEKPLHASFTWGPREIPGKQAQTGNWVAFLKDINMDLAEMKSLAFTYRSGGAVTNLEIKLKDQFDTTYGKSYSFGSAASDWTTFTVSRSDLKYLWGGDGSGKFDWDHVKMLELALSRTTDARDSGTFEVGKIEFRSAVSKSMPLKKRKKARRTKKGVTKTEKIKVVIDDFTDLNPTNRYFIVAGDDSTMTLEASRITFEADYSMRMRYNLQSSRPTGSWVEAQQRFAPSLDWTGVEGVKVWVKGDGSQNIFRFTLTDGDGNKWVCDNHDVLVSTDWLLVSMPIEAFVLYEDLYRQTRSTQQLSKKLHKIKQFGISLVSQPDRGSLSQGEIFVETLYVVGRGINPSTAVPFMDRLPVGIAIPLKNWNLGGTSNTLLEKIPTTGLTLTQNVLFKLMGNFNKFSVLGEIRLDSVFGNDDDGIRSKDGVLVSPNASVTLLDPMDGIDNIVIGNLWFNASPDIFANNNQYGSWGYKGALIEGWVDRLHHQTFFIKHSPDSYTIAGHYALNLGTLNINLIGTYYNQQPFVVSATRLEEDDKALLLDVTQRIFLPELFNLTIRVQGGYDWYQKYWDTSQQIETDEQLDGGLLNGEINFSDLSNVFWPGISLTGAYRYVDPNYKPEFRQDPGFWDVEQADQRGYLIRVHQKFGNAFLSAEYGMINRLSKLDDYYRERSVFSIGYNNWSSVDITLSQEFSTRKYHYVDPRYEYEGEPANLDENRREAITTFYTAYHFSGVLIISEWIQFKRIMQFDLDESYNEMFSVTKISYYPASNLTISLESKFSRYGREQDVPVIDTSDPYSIYEYTRLRVDLTF